MLVYLVYKIYLMINILVLGWRWITFLLAFVAAVRRWIDSRLMFNIVLVFCEHKIRQHEIKITILINWFSFNHLLPETCQLTIEPYIHLQIYWALISSLCCGGFHSRLLMPSQLSPLLICECNITQHTAVPRMFARCRTGTYKTSVGCPRDRRRRAFGGRNNVKDLPKSAPTDVERRSKFQSVEININFLSLTLPLTSTALYFFYISFFISYLFLIWKLFHWKKYRLYRDSNPERLGGMPVLYRHAIS